MTLKPQFATQVPKRDPQGNTVKYTTAHHVNSERRFNAEWQRTMVSHPFSHYRFGGHSYDLLRRKHQTYVHMDDPRAHIYGVILSYINHNQDGESALNSKFQKMTKCGTHCPFRKIDLAWDVDAAPGR